MIAAVFWGGVSGDTHLADPVHFSRFKFHNNQLFNNKKYSVIAVFWAVWETVPRPACGFVEVLE